MGGGRTRPGQKEGSGTAVVKKGEKEEGDLTKALEVINKVVFSGCSKMSRCKALEILRSEAYLVVRRNDEG